MPVSTQLDRAIERVDDERNAVDAKRAAFDEFIERVEALSPQAGPGNRSDSGPGNGSTVGGPTPVGVMATADSRSGRAASVDHCRQVIAAFAETVQPHSVDDIDDEPLLETIEAELSASVTGALAPTTDTPFSPTLKRAVLAAAHTRRDETEILRAALDREADQLAAGRETTEAITAWIADADETPLATLGFEALQARHETLAAHRTQCERLAETRQQFLRQSTSRGVDGGMNHRELVPYLYQAFPTDWPVLAAVARLDSTCADCQQAVRRHLVRRG